MPKNKFTGTTISFLFGVRKLATARTADLFGENARSKLRRKGETEVRHLQDTGGKKEKEKGLLRNLSEGEVKNEVRTRWRNSICSRL